MEQFITADLHFGHPPIIGYCARPFKDVQEMDEALIERWNAKVPRRAHVFILGDFTFRSNVRGLRVVTSRLNGRKTLILGNHDRGGPARSCSCFTDVRDFGLETKILGQHVTMCHYPLVTWNRWREGAWHLYGHVHNHVQHAESAMLPKLVNAMNVGIDLHPGLEPFSWNEVCEFMERFEGQLPRD